MTIPVRASLGLRMFLACALAAAAVGTAFAHHGTAVNYDSSKTITLDGTVTEFRWRNPHSALFLDVKDKTGKVIHYAIELPSPTLLSRGELGWTRHTFKPGDHVVFKVHPSRTGAPVADGGCIKACEVLVNGKPPRKEY
ncbi:MAG TPA: DUF6152 family protein [Gammaproteobacteria bacterium]|nr:DUF6152 family protein [Gammaproteobacteria bacterium]